MFTPLCICEYLYVFTNNSDDFNNSICRYSSNLKSSILLHRSIQDDDLFLYIFTTVSIGFKCNNRYHLQSTLILFCITGQ